jgi:imidazole glycerol-phosphate synthase subunit HisH
MIVIVDYGMGNLRNVRRGFAEVGHDATITDDPQMIARADKVVLPGVGAFGEAVRRIDAKKLRAALLDQMGKGTPLLGICLGMQLLYGASEESPGAVGLGVLSGEVKKFSDNLKVPHIGWNDVVASPGQKLLDVAGERSCFYFVHSFYAPVSEDTIARTRYGIDFSSAVMKGKTFGVQFHPEKSQDAGLEILKRFAELR